MGANKDLKYFHYFPKVLLKNWGKFIGYYDIYRKQVFTENTSLNKVGSIEAFSKEQRKLYQEIENRLNSYFTIEGKEIESLVGETINFEEYNGMKFILADKFIKNLGYKNLKIFIKMILMKSPIDRAYKKIPAYGDYKFDTEIVNSKQIDSYSIEWKEKLGIFNDKTIDENFELLSKNQNIWIANLPITFPWFDPGYVLVRKSGEALTFILQLSQHQFMIWESGNDISKVLDDSNEMNDSNVRELTNVLVSKFLTNPLATNIYFTDQSKEFIESNIESINSAQKRIVDFKNEHNEKLIARSPYVGGLFFAMGFIVENKLTIYPLKTNAIDSTLVKTIFKYDWAKTMFRNVDLSLIENIKAKDVGGKKGVIIIDGIAKMIDIDEILSGDWDNKSEFEEGEENWKKIQDDVFKKTR